MKTIYNAYVPIESQEQANRMKQICIDYGLPYWDKEVAFDLWGKEDWFLFNGKDFLITPYNKKEITEFGKTQVTESEFLELVKINFANSK